MAVPSCDSGLSREGGQREAGSARRLWNSQPADREGRVINRVMPKGRHDLKLLLSVPRGREQPGGSDAVGLPVLILAWGAVDLGNGAVPANTFY